MRNASTNAYCTGEPWCTRDRSNTAYIADHYPTLRRMRYLSLLNIWRWRVSCALSLLSFIKVLIVHLSVAEVSAIVQRKCVAKDKTYYTLLSDEGERLGPVNNFLAVSFRSNDCWKKSMSQHFKKQRKWEFILEDSRYRRSICSSDSPFVSGIMKYL